MVITFLVCKRGKTLQLIKRNIGSKICLCLIIQSGSENQSIKHEMHLNSSTTAQSQLVQERENIFFCLHLSFMNISYVTGFHDLMKRTVCSTTTIGVFWYRNIHRFDLSLWSGKSRFPFFQLAD